MGSGALLFPLHEESLLHVGSRLLGEEQYQYHSLPPRLLLEDCVCYLPRQESSAHRFRLKAGNDPKSEDYLVVLYQYYQILLFQHGQNLQECHTT